MKKKDFKAFQSTFLAKEDLAGPTVFTIDSVDEQEIQGDGGKEDKPVMHFTDCDKPMILNNINWQTCEDAFGDESDSWHGKKIELYVDPNVMFGNKRVGGLRMQLPSTKRTATTPAASANGEYWDWDRAVAECGRVGITKPDLIERLKLLGMKTWKADRDTMVVKLFIEDEKRPATAQEEFDAMPAANEVSFG